MNERESRRDKDGGNELPQTTSERVVVAFPKRETDKRRGEIFATRQWKRGNKSHNLLLKKSFPQAELAEKPPSPPATCIQRENA